MADGFSDVFRDGSNMSVVDPKSESPSTTGTPRGGFQWSRASSIGSLPEFGSSASSAQNTDDEDSDGHHRQLSYKERRREAHTFAEQKRRDAIKKGYEELQTLVPTCQQSDSIGGQKLSKAAVLQKSLDYIQYLMGQKNKQTDDLDALRKEVMALKIMKANYETIVKAHHNTPVQGNAQVPEEVKVQVFQQIMDKMFESFNESISVTSFNELSGSVFSWLEEHCKPQRLREVTMNVLQPVIQPGQQQQQHPGPMQ